MNDVAPRRCSSRRILTLLLGSVVFCLTASHAIAQKRMTDAEYMTMMNQSYDVEVGGIEYRVPGSYRSLAPTNMPDRMGREISESMNSTLHFAFWVSDSEPLSVSERRNLETKMWGAGFFWPPETGRPFLSGADFFVHVPYVFARDMEQALESQKISRAVRARFAASTDKTKDYGNLRCTILQNGIFCANPIENDPAVIVSGDRPVVFKEGSYTFLSMYAYSRADGLDMAIRFPDAGLPRWQEILCRSLTLIRTWRVSDAPPPSSDCAKLPRLSMN